MKKSLVTLTGTVVAPDIALGIIVSYYFRAVDYNLGGISAQTNAYVLDRNSDSPDDAVITSLKKRLVEYFDEATVDVVTADNNTSISIEVVDNGKSIKLVDNINPNVFSLLQEGDQ